MSAEALKGHLDVMLLAVLEDGPRHGYAVIEQLRHRSSEVFDLPEGTIYPALHRLERAGLLESDWDELGGRRRRLYRLTHAGTSSLHQRRAEWAAFAAGVQRVLGKGEGGAWPSPA